jgi:zinc protease
MEKTKILLQNIRHYVLDNGLKVICLPKKESQIVCIQIWYLTGSANEYDGIRGISHFFEHMMFRGSKNIGPEEHAKKINEVGGHYNAFTAEDVTAFINSVPKEYLDMVLYMESDRMSDLIINEKVLETERNVIIEEYQTYMNNPLSKAFLEFRKEFFKDNPYEYSALGRLEDIKSINVNDCQNYYKKWYCPNNAIMVIVGDFENSEMVFEKVEAHFKRHERREISAEKKEIKKLNSNNVFMKREVDFDVPVCIVGYPAPCASSVDTIPLEILQIILSHGETGRLNKEVVRKNSLAIMAGGINQFLKYSGMSLFFAIFTPNISINKIKDAILNQIEQIKDGNIKEKEMEKVKNSVIMNRVFELYLCDNICQRLAYSEAIEGNYKLWVERLSALDTITIDDLINAAKKYWNSSESKTLYLKPKKINPLVYFMGLLRKFLPNK